VLHTPSHSLAQRAALLAVAALLSLLFTGSARASPPEGVAPPRPAVMATLRRIESTLRTSRYDHATRVDVRAGRYDFDCSGMVAWVLARGAPQAHAATVRRAGGRALARDYYRQIVATRPGRPAQGWARVARVADALPGDVVAWLTARGRRSQNTGHVLFVVEAPRPVPGAPGAYAVRVADASAYQHTDDTRAAAGRDGFGMGTMLLFADPATGAVRGYGWRAGFPMWGPRRGDRDRAPAAVTTSGHGLPQPRGGHRAAGVAAAGVAAAGVAAAGVAAAGVAAAPSARWIWPRMSPK
jgi:hypothetical protein